MDDRCATDVGSSSPAVSWWCKSNDLRLASVRMRAALVMRMMLQRGIATEWFDEKRMPRYRCVVVSKRYDDDTVRQLHRFKRDGGRLVIDLCDNHFLPSSPQPRHRHLVENLRALAALADAVVTSSAVLAEIVGRECPAVQRVVVIGDVPDDLSIIDTGRWQRAWNDWKLARECARLDRQAPAGVTRLVWFGNADKRQENSGMGELARIAPRFAALNRVYPLHLTVISNSAQRYREQIAAVAPSSRYIEWHPLTFDALLRLQHIALIPAHPNESTECKSDNRVVTTLRAGVAVVADPVPSYAAHRDVIQLGNLEAGLRHYLADPAQRIADAARGQAGVTQAGHAESVLARWIDACGL